MKRLVILAAIAFGAAPSAVSAQSPQPHAGLEARTADADNGERRLARRWCSSCHVVAANQRQATGEAPPFATIASKPDFDAAKIALFLLDPHPKRPDMGLSRAEEADLTAYISTLAK
jgi:mono/diheme cytochrome c family protein